MSITTLVVFVLAACGEGDTSATDVSSANGRPTASASVEPSELASIGPSSSVPTDRSTEQLFGAEGIAFVRQEESGEYVPFGQVYVVDSDGSVRQLTDLDTLLPTGGAQSVKWSPDGDMLAYAYGPSITAGLGIIDTEDEGHISVDGGFYFWSPDGNRLAVGGQLDMAPPGAMNSVPVGVVDPASGEAEEVGSGLLLGWHPDGERVLVMRELGANEAMPGTLQLVLVSVADGSEEELMQGASMARWSPDGSQVAYVVEDNPCTGIACQRIVVGREGSTELTQVAVGFEPVWSPDGTRLAYTGFADAGAILRVVDVASGHTIELPGGSEHPAAWAPDGMRIAFAALSQEVQQSVIRIVDMGSGELVFEFLGTAPSWRP